MKSRNLKISAVFSALLAAWPSAVPAADAAGSLPVESLGSTNHSRFGLNYSMGFNMSADFKHIGGFAALNPATNPRHPLRTPNGALYNYDNGYIYPDDTTESGHPGYTWYYGYVRGTAMTGGETPTTFDLSRSSSPANITSRDNDGDPQHGMELTYNRQLGRAGHALWGLEGALGFSDLTIQDSRTYRGTVVRATDTFRAGGDAVLKPAPQAFPSQGPAEGDPNGWPLVALPVAATSSDSFSGGALVTGHREFEAQVLSLRLGPYYDMPIDKHWTFSLSAGLLLLEVFSDFKFNETVSLDPAITLVNLPAENHQGSGTKDDLLVGGYLGGAFSYAVNERLRLFAGAQVHFAQNYSHSESGKSALLHLNEAVVATFGATFGF